MHKTNKYCNNPMVACHEVPKNVAPTGLHPSSLEVDSIPYKSAHPLEGYC